ncbi:MAG: type VI secretion system-associated protein TagF [Myxococcota bacterium]
MAAGLFGKIPAQGDFVTHNVGDPIAQHLDRWLQEAQAHLAKVRAALPVQPVRFLFAEPSCPNAVVGAMVGSQDQVGRKFALSIFGYVPLAQATLTYPTAHITFDPFLDAASQLLHEAERLPLDAIRTKVDALVLPGQGQFDQAVTLRDATLRNAPVHEFHERLFVDVSDGRHCYAYNTLLTAIRGAGPQPVDKGATVLDCPIAVDLDVFAWLEMLRRLLRWNTAPSFFWLEEPLPRLLVSLGTPTPKIPVFLANPRSESNHLWPLTTHREAAVRSAAQSLGSMMQSYGPGSQASLGELINTLEQHL